MEGYIWSHDTLRNESCSMFLLAVRGVHAQNPETHQTSLWIIKSL